MSDGLTPAQLDEIEAVARADIAVRVAPPTPGEPGRGLREVCEFLEVATSRNVLALVAEVRELRAKVEGATQQPAIDTLYGEGASSDLWRAALGLERAYAGFCPTGDHYCLQSVGHYCQGDQQFIEELGEEA